MFEGKWLGIVCIFIEFQMLDLSLLCKQYYALVILTWSKQANQMCFNLSRTASIYSRTVPFSFCYNLKTLPQERKGASLQFFLFFSPTPWLWTWPRVGRETEARDRHSEARVHAAERRSRKASCQPPAEGKTMGHQPERFGKKDESGSLSLNTAWRHCSEPQGLRGGGRRQPWA